MDIILIVVWKRVPGGVCVADVTFWENSVEAFVFSLYPGVVLFAVGVVNFWVVTVENQCIKSRITSVLLLSNC